MSESNQNEKKTSEITLFVKAGADGNRYGACPFCQRLFMILIIKGQILSDIKFKVMTVNIAKPPVEFRQHSLRRVPALIDGESMASDNVDDILQYLSDYYPTQQLDYDNIQAEAACNHVFQKFCFFIKEVSKDSSLLMTELTKLNNYLLSQRSRFLCGDTITHIDIEILPKLHHIRIAARYLKDFVIPANLKGLWHYLQTAYQLTAFTESCPSDQEIILHWADRPETLNLTLEQHAALIKEEPKFSFDIPE